eukprot:TRINITY_DN47881_c0_g1_i2.p1 TRINITY_DN47881_c0_g1~~TRINITY_DN47881_c0_g1_i2.p1  ORF type:complete len:431 (-),score=33.57 TRINITY_DN47881_c0_g1_i2:68-1333(-)
MTNAAETLKAQGNACFSKGNWNDSISWYTKAIDTLAELENTEGTEIPARLTASLFSNRSASYLQMGELKEALADAEACVKADPKWVKGHIRKGAALMQLRDCVNCIKAYERALVFEPTNSQVKQAVHDARILKQMQMVDGPPPDPSLMSGVVGDGSDGSSTATSTTTPPPTPADQATTIHQLAQTDAPWLCVDTVEATPFMQLDVKNKSSLYGHGRKPHLEAQKKYNILNATWWKNWCSYVQWGAAISTQEGETATSSPAPGPINNKDLVTYFVGGEESEVANQPALCTMKWALCQNQDWVAVPPKVWDHLYSWYGGGPNIQRQIEMGGVSRTIPYLDLYPILVKFSQWLIGSPTPEKSTVQRWVKLSATMSVKEILNLLCAKLYPSPPHKYAAPNIQQQSPDHPWRQSSRLGKFCKPAQP